jgi:hypothetical protein
MRVTATRTLAADVWPLLAEPYHLADWWPGYSGVEPDRRGLTAGARWKVVRRRTPGLLRRGGGEGLIVVEQVEPGRALAWNDVGGHYSVAVAVAGPSVSVSLDAAWWRLLDLRAFPRQALGRLEALCETDR